MDVNVQAFRFVQKATTDAEPDLDTRKTSSRKGGLKGGPARARAISPDRRVEIAKRASSARWSKDKVPPPPEE